MKRLRVFDLNTPWFWFTVFYNPNAYGTDWLRISLWSPHQFKKWWIHFWLWEDPPSYQGAFVAVSED
jgi:hypothetical protein